MHVCSMPGLLVQYYIYIYMYTVWLGLFGGKNVWASSIMSDGSLSTLPIGAIMGLVRGDGQARFSSPLASWHHFLFWTLHPNNSAWHWNGWCCSLMCLKNISPPLPPLRLRCPFHWIFGQRFLAWTSLRTMDFSCVAKLFSEHNVPFGIGSGDHSWVWA